jgi:hypothetical protein
MNLKQTEGTRAVLVISVFVFENEVLTKMNGTMGN